MYWLQLLHGLVITPLIKYGVKLQIHFKHNGAAVEVWNGKVILSPTPCWACNYLSMLIHVSKRGQKAITSILLFHEWPSIHWILCAVHIFIDVKGVASLIACISTFYSSYLIYQQWKHQNSTLLALFRRIHRISPQRDSDAATVFIHVVIIYWLHMYIHVHPIYNSFSIN